MGEISNLSIKIPNRNNLRIEPLREFDEKLLFDDNPAELLNKPPYRHIFFKYNYNIFLLF